MALMGASLGMLGTARCQYHLRQTFLTLNVIPVTRPEVMLGIADQRLDADLRLVDEKSREMVARLVMSLKVLIEKVRS